MTPKDVYTRREILRWLRSYYNGANQFAHPGISGARMKALGMAKRGPHGRAQMAVIGALIRDIGGRVR